MSDRVKTTYEHIVLDKHNRPVIDGTRMTVAQLASEHLAWELSPEELHRHHPQLTLGQIYSALAYYWDHQAEIDSATQRELAEIDRLREASAADSAFAKLRKKDS
jgi:uncharacterized protein (DUF433 family)